MTLVLISKVSFPIRTGTSPSNRYWLFALVPWFLLQKPTRLYHPRSKSAWLVMSAVACQLCRNWTACMTTLSLAEHQYGLSLYSTWHLWRLWCSSTAIDRLPQEALILQSLITVRYGWLYRMSPLGQQIVRCGGFLWLKPVATSLVRYSRAEVVECPGRNPCWSKAGSTCVLIVVSMRASITFSVGRSSQIGRYVVPREESLPGLGIGMAIHDFQIAGIRHDLTESINSAVRYLIALGPRFFRWNILSLSAPKALVLL